MKLPEDQFIRELLPEFIDSWIEDLEERFKPLLDAKDEKEMYRLAHTLKGSCLQFGIDDMAQIGINIMDLVKKNDWDSIATYEDKLKSSFKEMKKMLEEA